MARGTSKSKPKKRRKKRLILPATSMERWVFIGYIILIPLLPLMLGATTSRPWPMFIARMAILVLFSLYAGSSLLNRRKVKINGFWLILLGAGAFTLFQLVPLPSFLISLLSPEADRIFQMMLGSLGLYGQGQWRPLSLDPAETWLGISGFFSLLMVYVVGANLFSQKTKMRRIMQTIAITGFSLAMIGFVQKALGFSRIFGFIPFEGSAPFFFSSFVNPNHLAGFLGMCVPVQVSLALKETDRNKRTIWLIQVVATSTAIFLSLSKGGIIAFIAGQLFLAFLMFRRQSRRWDYIWVQAAVVAVLLLSAWLSLHELASEFDFAAETGVTNESRVEVWKDAAGIVKDFPVVGIGPEAFKVVYPLYKTLQSDKRYEYPENIIVQVLCESGIIMGGLILAAFIGGLVFIFREKHLKRLEMGAFGAIAVIAIHNYIDFNLSAFAIAVPFFLLFSILLHQIANKKSSRVFAARVLTPYMLVAFWIVGGGIVLAGEGLWLKHRLPESQIRLHGAAYDRKLGEDAFRDVLAAEVARHPADYYLRLLASEHYLTGSRAGIPEKLLHLKKASILNPTDTRPDIFIGRAYLGVREQENAVKAYRQAMLETQPGKSLDDLWAEMIARGISPGDLLKVAGDIDDRRIELARFLEEREENRLAKELLSNLKSESDHEDPEAMYLLGSIALKEGSKVEADFTAARLLKLFPRDSRGYSLTGEIAHSKGEFEQALKWFEKALKLAPGDFSILVRLAGIEMELGNFEEARGIAGKVHALSWKHPNRKLMAYHLSGELASAEGKLLSARREYELALLYAPKDGEIHYRLGQVHESLENSREALRQYFKARKYGYEGPDLDKRIEAIKKKIHGFKPIRYAP